MTDNRTRKYARRLARLVGVTTVVHVALAWFVYRDAADREVPGGRWAALTLLGGLFGLAGYLRRR
ncbi:hypothetical protein [Halobaculum rubrum]|uniref:hypothetical protein n=1 Tax=Halobaculum rubrum TaxID=2872158 RepID=UPI001CA3CE3C|nr:hypothetical protein [Halobaculum rubrum]QZX98298.1 hypothetical protein K6T25_08290 [Halobaculum rubrum]